MVGADIVADLALIDLDVGVMQGVVDGKAEEGVAYIPRGLKSKPLSAVE